MKNLLACLCFFSCLSVAAADVPDDLDFAGIRLKIKSEARRKIAEDVEKLTKVSKSGQAKIERIQLYFPIIERILAEEGLPNDFKYLVVQESSLVSDAVSSSNAVGFWQFKRETALEMGLAVNSDVDERKHIVASTRAAARYLKRNNFFFNNWVYALLAYNTGVGGAKNLIDARERGSTRMDIDGGTHWYVLKYLAHRIAFENIASSGPYRATLSLLVTSSHAPMVQMMLPRIKERVNAAYGYAAVSRITLTQTAADGFAEGQTPFTGPATPPPPDLKIEAAAVAQAAQIGDADLRSALEALGKNILTRRQSEHRKKTQ